MRKRKITVAIAFAVVLLVVGLPVLVDRTCTLRPPGPPVIDNPITRLSVETNGPLRRLGENWLLEEPDLRILYLRGDPYSVGYANGRLSGHLMARLERDMVRMGEFYVPVALFRYLLVEMVTFRYRDLLDHIPPSLQTEIRGIADGYREEPPGLGPRFHRIAHYHAFHDLSHAAMDNPLVLRAGTPYEELCTSFAASGAATRGGHAILGRNFDFEGGRRFDTEKVVVFVRPDEGIPFVSVAWAGMSGVLSGLNAKGIAITVNAGASSDRRRIGTPASLVAREVLQHADKMDEAVTIIREAEVFVSDSYLVVDGKTGEAAVVEKSPARSAVRAGNPLLCANHFLSPEFAEDRANRNQRRGGTTAQRLARLEELLPRLLPLTPEKAQRILRDRQGTGNRDLGLGNRNSIDALIATHGVVIDATALRLWVSTSPHLLGRWVGIDAGRVLATGRPARVADLPPDPLLSNGGYERYLRYRSLLGEAEEGLSSGRSAEAEGLAREAVGLNPSHFAGHEVLGRALLELGRSAEAQAAFREALARDPHYEKTRTEIRARLAR